MGSNGGDRIEMGCPGIMSGRRWLSDKKASQVERSASARVLRQECAKHVRVTLSRSAGVAQSR